MKRIPTEVVMESDEYGTERFGPYISIQQALKAMGRISANVAKLNDGIERRISITVMGRAE